MIYRELGKTGLKVSVVGFGGEWLNGLSERETCGIIEEAMLNGVNCMDIFMPQPDTRSNIGKAINGAREKFFIQGHLCTVFENDQYERTRDLSKTKSSFEDLLSRLSTDYIDIGMIHYVDTDEDYAAVFDSEIISYAQELKRGGVVRHIGLSSHNPRVALKAVESGLIEVLMFSINPAFDMENTEADIYQLIDYKGFNENGWTIDPARSKLYAACENSGIGITVMKPFGAGTLLRAESSPFGKPLSVVQCCHYCLSRPGVASVLAGCRTRDEVKAAASYCGASDEDRSYSHIFVGNENIKMSGRCMYCNHCQPCPAGIDVAEVTKFLDLARVQSDIPETVREHYMSLPKKACDCLMCGQCEPNCPFGVEIRENMRAAQKLFE